MQPAQGPSEPLGNSPSWSLLNAWAARHGVDDDLALLICACAAAHAAGHRLDFEGTHRRGQSPAPTLIATAGDTGFYRAARAAIEPLQATPASRASCSRC